MAIIFTLDESVTDPDLPKVGEMFFDISMTEPFTFRYSTNAAVEYTARIIGDGNFYSDDTYTTSVGKSISQTTWFLYCSPGTYRIGITQKYLARDIGDDLNLADKEKIEFDLRSLKYCSFNNQLFSSHWKLKNFAGENIPNLIYWNANDATGIEGDVSEFQYVSDQMIGLNVGYTGLYGDGVAAFGPKTQLNLLVTHETQITGTYDQVCDAMYTNGRRSGTMTIKMAQDDTLHTVTFDENGWTEA